MKILGIETSCDETSAAVIESTDRTKPVRLLSNVVASSLSLHAQTGGIIPEIAAREQIKYILPVITEALETSSVISNEERDPSRNGTISIPDIDAIAITVGPGLIGSLLVGVETAKTLSLIWNKPLIPVNHLFGHMYANWISPLISPLPLGEGKSEGKRPERTSNVPSFPALSLIVSGGHTDLVLMHDHQKITWIAGTRDDAAGEAFDKIGRLLGLPYPAGPTIEQLAKEGDPKRFNFPRPLLHEPTYDFSFSGLKTAVLREVEKLQYITAEESEHAVFSQDDKRTADPRKKLYASEQKTVQLNDQTIKDLAHATQDAIIDVLVKKTLKAAQEYNVKSIILSGGVAANGALRERFEQELHTTYNILNTEIFVPQKFLCTDNGAMIAAAGFYNYEEKLWNQISANPELYFD